VEPAPTLRDSRADAMPDTQKLKIKTHPAGPAGEDVTPVNHRGK
jgi:hypothetical protein